jgi:hypothetical protein
LAASKTESPLAAAMAFTLRWPSILERMSHSLVFRLIWPSRLSCTTNSGTRSVEGIFLESTRHSSRRRAASMRRLVLLLVMVFTSVAGPGSKRNSPCLQMARA